MDINFHDIFNAAWPPLVGGLGAYLAIRIDLAVITAKLISHSEEIASLRAWRERTSEHNHTAD